MSDSTESNPKPGFEIEELSDDSLEEVSGGESCTGCGGGCEQDCSGTGGGLSQQM